MLWAGTAVLTVEFSYWMLARYRLAEASMRCVLVVLSSLVLGSPAQAEDADGFLDTHIQCPRSGDGVFTRISQNMAGDRQRVVAIYESGTIKSLQAAVSADAETFDTWLDVDADTTNPRRKRMFQAAAKTIDAIRREACLDSGSVSARYASEIEANLARFK